MTIGTIDESQRKAATVVGLSYLLALPPAIFAEFYVRTQLIAFDNAAQTARNIMAHERRMVRRTFVAYSSALAWLPTRHVISLPM